MKKIRGGADAGRGDNPNHKPGLGKGFRDRISETDERHQSEIDEIRNAPRPAPHFVQDDSKFGEFDYYTSGVFVDDADDAI